MNYPNMSFTGEGCGGREEVSQIIEQIISMYVMFSSFTYLPSLDMWKLWVEECGYGADCEGRNVFIIFIEFTGGYVAEGCEWPKELQKVIHTFRGFG